MKNRQAKKNHGKDLENSSQVQKRALKYYQDLNMELIGGVSAVFFLVVSCLLTFSQLGTNTKPPAAARLSDRAAALAPFGRPIHIIHKESSNKEGNKVAALVQRQNISPVSVVEPHFRAAGGGEKRQKERKTVLSSARRPAVRGVSLQRLRNTEVVADYRQPFFKQHYRTNNVSKPDIDKAGQNLAKGATGRGMDEGYSADNQSLDVSGGPGTNKVLLRREKFLVMRVARLTRDIQSGYADRWWNSVVARNPQRAKYATEAPRVLLEKYQRELTALRAKAG